MKVTVPKSAIGLWLQLAPPSCVSRSNRGRRDGGRSEGAEGAEGAAAVEAAVAAEAVAAAEATA